MGLFYCADGSNFRYPTGFPTTGSRVRGVEMTDEKKRDPIDRMTDAYEQMLERVDGFLELAEKSTLPTLRRALDQARERRLN